jgi:hypothetical protein
MYPTTRSPGVDARHTHSLRSAQARQTEGQVAAQERDVCVLVARQDVTGPTGSGPRTTTPATWSATRRAVIRYGLAAGEFARVVHVIFLAGAARSCDREHLVESEHRRSNVPTCRGACGARHNSMEAQLDDPPGPGLDTAGELILSIRSRTICP